MVDHDRLTKVWRLELLCRKYKAEIKDWEEKIEARAQSIRQSQINIRQADQQHEDLEKQLQRWDKDIQTLERRIALVEKGIQSGSMQDLDQAQAQIHTFREQIDTLELSYLEGLEKQEALRFQQAVDRDRIKIHRQFLTEHTDAFGQIRLTLEDKIDRCVTESEGLLVQMNPKISNLYRLMLPKKERPVVGVSNGACGGCYLDLPTELAWTAVHRNQVVRCPTCGVFLLPVEIVV